MVRLGRVARGPKLPYPWNGAVWLAVGLIVVVTLHSAGGVLVGLVLAAWGILRLGDLHIVMVRRNRHRSRW